LPGSLPVDREVAGDTMSRARVFALGVALALFAAEASAQSICTADPANRVVRFQTSLGDIDVTMCDADASLIPTIDNFIDNYVTPGAYTDTGIIHRSVTAASGGLDVIQGGGVYIDASGLTQLVPTQPPIDLQAEFSNVRGTIAMARTNDPDSATSQWFLNVQDNTVLDPSSFPGTTGGFAVFGEVTAGMSVVDAIHALPIWQLNTNLFSEVPLDGFPNDGSSVVPYFVYVTDVSVVPEPAAALQGACAIGVIAAFAARSRRRAR